jgi:hypothetical protein
MSAVESSVFELYQAAHLSMTPAIFRARLGGDEVQVVPGSGLVLDRAHRDMKVRAPTLNGVQSGFAVMQNRHVAALSVGGSGGASSGGSSREREHPARPCGKAQAEGVSSAWSWGEPE